MGKREFNRVRRIALALPGVQERTSHGAPCFFIRNKRPLCYYHDNHRGDGRISLWFAATPDVQDAMLRIDPKRFFRPTTSSAGAFDNWLAVFLDVGDPPNWTEIAALLERAYRTVAPNALIAELAPAPTRSPAANRLRLPRLRRNDASVSALRYGKVCAALLGAGNLSAGKMFGAPGLRICGKFFCCFHSNNFLVKLPLARVSAFLASGEAVQANHFFADRPLTGWIKLAQDGDADWITVARESCAFVQRQKK